MREAEIELFYDEDIVYKQNELEYEAQMSELDKRIKQLKEELRIAEYIKSKEGV